MTNRIPYILLLFVLATAGYSQSQVTDDTYSLLPPTYVLPVVVAQADCPLVIEKFFPVKDSAGRVHTEYGVRNTGSKVIKSYRIARWYSDNTGFLQYGVMPSGSSSLKPNASIETSTGKRLRSLDSPKNNVKSMKKIAFAMIVEIEFADGSVFDAKDQFSALTTHLQLFEASYESNGRK